MSPKEIPGFFYDEEKDRYFPIHMKPAYDKEKKIKEKAERLIETAQPPDLYRFMKNGPQRFDSLTEKLSRITIQEIIWPHQIQFDADKMIYYRYSWEDGMYAVQKVHVESGQILKEFHHDCSDPLVDFKVFENVFNDKEVYAFVKGKPDSAEDIENNLDIVADGFQRTDTVTIGPYGYNIVSYKDQIIFARPEGNGSYTVLSLCLGLRTGIKRPYDRFAFFCYHHGLEPVNADVYSVFFCKLKDSTQSSAKWMHYDEEQDKLLILTYHGGLYSVEFKDRNRDLIELFHVNDMFDGSEGRFEDLMIQCKGKAILMGFKHCKEIIVVDWSCLRRIIKKFTFTKPLERFQLSSDYSTILIHFKS